MGLMSKMADLGNDMVRKDAEFTVSQMKKPDGRLPWQERARPISCSEESPSCLTAGSRIWMTKLL